MLTYLIVNLLLLIVSSVSNLIFIANNNTDVERVILNTLLPKGINSFYKLW